MAEVSNKLVQVADLVNFATKTDTLYPRKAAVTAEIDEKVAAQIASTYKPAGTIASLDDLPEAKAENLGKVVDVSEEFTTTENFREGAGKVYPAGTNVVVVVGDTDDEYMYDALSGAIDLTPYAKTTDVTDELTKKVDKLEGMGLSSNDFTAAYKTKLDGMEIASSTEVEQAISEALGLTTSSEEQGENS